MKTLLLIILSALLAACTPKEKPASTPDPDLPKKGENPPPKEAAVKKAAAPKVSSCFVTKLAPKGALEIKKNASSETLGGLSLDMKAKQVVALLGEPDSKTKPEEEAATGYMRAEWTWKSKGLSLSMHHGKDAVSVIMISASSSFTGSTGCGIKMGSSRTEVTKLYGPYYDKNHSGKESVIVGSIYGGISIGFKNDKVSSISIGAFAE